MKNFLFILRRPPYEGNAVRESLDMLMTVAAFDQPVRMLFLDDGVFLLKSGQNPEGLGVRPLEPLLAALEVYGVEELWVEKESLHERGLALAQLILPVQGICRADVAGLIAEADIVVNS
jgi:tRNA 2-thiouridine synthesizing protein C